MATTKKSALQSALVLTASSIGLQLLAFAYRVFISRVTGPEGIGVLQLVMPVYGILISLTYGGFTTAITQLASERGALGDHGGMRLVVRLSLIGFAILFVVVAIPTALFSGWISESVLGDAETRLALLILLPCLLLTGLENIFKSWFYGVKHVKPPAISDQLEQIVRIAAVVGLLLWLRPTDPAMAAAVIVAGMTVSELFSSTLLAVWYRKARPSDGKAAHPGGLFKKLMAIALPVSASALAGNLLSAANTVLVPKRLMASGMPQQQAVGMLGVALGMALPLFFLPMAFMGPLVMVMLPRLSESVAVGDMADAHRKMGKALYATGLIALPAVAVLAPIGPAVMQLLYQQTVPLDYILLTAVAMTLTYYQMITAGMLNGTGFQSRAMVSTIVGDILQLGITWFTVSNPQIGIYGFFWGMIAGAALSVVMNIRCLNTKIEFRVKWAQWVVLPGLAAIACALACYNVNSLMKGLGWADMPAMLWAVAAAAVVFLLSLKIQGVRIGSYVKSLLPGARAKAKAAGIMPFFF